MDTQTSDFYHVFGYAETAAASWRNHRGRGRAARDERSSIADGDAAPDFIGRARDGRQKREIIGEDSIDIPK